LTGTVSVNLATSDVSFISVTVAAVNVASDEFSVAPGASVESFEIIDETV
jgi:hypothetical protein